VEILFFPNFPQSKIREKFPIQFKRDFLKPWDLHEEILRQMESTSMFDCVKERDP
jgi:hypothetical protein